MSPEGGAVTRGAVSRWGPTRDFPLASGGHELRAPSSRASCWMRPPEALESLLEMDLNQEIDHRSGVTVNQTSLLSQ